MRKRRLVILIFAILLIFGYLFLFHKSYHLESVPANADMVAVIDVKNVTRSYIKEFLLHPSRWLKISVKAQKEFNWKSVFRIPDYVCIFHLKGQGIGKWYTRLNVKSRYRFDEAIALFHFQKSNIGPFVLYSNASAGVHLLVNGDEVIVSTYSCTRYEILNTGKNLFLKKQFLSEENSKFFVSTSHHLIFLFRNGNYFSRPGTVVADVEAGRVNIGGKLFPVEQSFAQIEIGGESENDILDINLSAIPKSYLNFFPDSVKQKWSNVIGLPVDSVFLNNFYNWRFHLSGFREHIDTAVTFEFDENFNEASKSTIIKSTEPVLTLSASGTGAENIYNILKNHFLLEPQLGKMRFTGFPLWPMYASYSEKKFILSNSKWKEGRDSVVPAIMNLTAYPSRIPDSLFRFVPDNLRPWLKNTRTISLKLLPDKNSVKIEGKLIREFGSYF